MSGAGHATTVEFLRRDAWPLDLPEVIETHMSWVFLTSDRAYKLKKPVVGPYLDYRALPARKADCEAEVRLNQPLAPGVYLGVAAVCASPSGRLHVGRVGGMADATEMPEAPDEPDGPDAPDGPDGPDAADTGEVVDWLVVMRRLSRSSTLERRAAAGSLRLGDADEVVDALAAFYRAAPQLAEPADRYRHRLAEAVIADRHELLHPAHGLDPAYVGRLTDALQNWALDGPEVGDRGRRLVDGHGDLRPEHVFLGQDGPVVIDRITFDADLRTVDPHFDIALLAAECELLGADLIAERIAARLGQVTGDMISPQTVSRYRSMRALTRARLSVAHLREHTANRAKWTRKTARYLALAYDHLDGGRRPGSR